LASEASEAIAEKLFVNEVAEMLGVAVDELVELALELEDEDDELPHAAIKPPTPTASAVARIQRDFNIALPLSFCHSLKLVHNDPRPLRRTLANPAAAVQSG
jgi:hypothetical protein